MVVLVQSLKEVFHPVAKRLECGRSQFAPNVRELTVEQRTRNFIQFTAHSHFASEGLRRQIADKLNGFDNNSCYRLSFIAFTLMCVVALRTLTASSEALRWAPYVSNNSALEHDEDQE